MDKEEVLRKVTPIADRMERKKQELLKKYQKSPQTMSAQMKIEEEVVVRTSIELADYLTEEIKALNLLKYPYPTELIDYTYIYTFLKNKKQENTFGTFTPESIIMFVEALNRYELKSN